MMVHILGVLRLRVSKIDQTYLWVELVDPPNGLLDTPFLDGLTNFHAFLDHCMVDVGWETCLPSELDGGVREAFYEEVVEDEGVHIARKATDQFGLEATE